MPNELSDESFETGIPWTFVDQGQRFVDPISRTGDACAYVGNLTLTSFGIDVGGAFYQDIPFSAGKTYEFDAWIYPIVAEGEEPLNLTIQKLGMPGNPIRYSAWLLWSNQTTEPGIGDPEYPVNEWSKWSAPKFTPTENFTGRVRYRFLPRGVDGSDYLLIDDVSVDRMAKRKDIKAAIVSQLGSITVAGGYSIDVGSSFDRYVRPDCIETFPSIMVVYGPEEKTWTSNDRVEFHRMRGAIEFVVRLDHRAEDADDVLDLLAADIEKNLSTQTDSQFLGLNYVDDVRVRRVAPVEATEEVTDDHRVWMLIVEVFYKYDRLDP